VMKKRKARDQVVLSFRPEHVTVRRADSLASEGWDGITIPAQLSFEFFLGVMIRMEAVTPKRHILIIEMPFERRRMIDCKIGDSMLLSVPFEHLHVY
jgi:hypothetical protein